MCVVPDWDQNYGMCREEASTFWSVPFAQLETVSGVLLMETLVFPGIHVGFPNSSNSTLGLCEVILQLLYFTYKIVKAQLTYNNSEGPFLASLHHPGSDVN